MSRFKKVIYILGETKDGDYVKIPTFGIKFGALAVTQTPPHLPTITHVKSGRSILPEKFLGRLSFLQLCRLASVPIVNGFDYDGYFDAICIGGDYVYYDPIEMQVWSQRINPVAKVIKDYIEARS